ncbi:MAG: hypothetical protein K2N99_01875, partial [Malacoplasma sp.]|nr:hypothetical protein [Malacoplasma sp.]
MEKDLIESFGVFDESSLEDYDFLDDKCVFITFGEKFDYLSFSEAISNIFDTPLLCYIAGTYFYYDENHIFSTEKNPFEISLEKPDLKGNLNGSFENTENTGCLPDGSCCSDDCFCLKSEDEETTKNISNGNDEILTSIEVKEFKVTELDESGFGKVEFVSDESETELKPKGISPEELDEIFKKDSKNYQNTNNLDFFNFFDEEKETKNDENFLFESTPNKDNEIINDTFEFKVTDEPDLNIFDETFNFESEIDVNSCCNEQDCQDCEGCSWDFSEDFDYNDILNSVEEENKKENTHHLECVCEDKTEGDLEMSDNNKKETNFADNEAIIEFESINTDLDNTNKLDSVESIFEEDTNTESIDLDALINENEYEQIFSDLSNLSNEDNFDLGSEIDSINDKDLITAEELEKILSSNDDLNKNLFVDNTECIESESIDEDYVSDEPFNFEDFFTEITTNDLEEVKLDSELENEKNDDIFSTNEINLDELLKFSENDDDIKTKEIELDQDLNNDLLSLKAEDWNQNQNFDSSDFAKTDDFVNLASANIDNDLSKIEEWDKNENDFNLEEITKLTNFTSESITESLDSLSELDWNKNSFDEIKEVASEDNETKNFVKENSNLENWSEFVSISESLPKTNKVEVDNSENLELAEEVKEFFKNQENTPFSETDFTTDIFSDSEPEFVLPAENKEDNPIVESIVVDNNINENTDTNDFFVNFDPSVENINYEDMTEKTVLKSDNNIVEKYKFEPDISDSKIVVDKKITNDLQRFLAELKQ